MSQLVPSPPGRARIAGRATARFVAHDRKTFQNPEGKERKKEKTKKLLIKEKKRERTPLRT
jgi:hypothetical protein